MKNSMDIKKISSRLSETEKVHIVVFGDYALDKYLYIDPKRDEPSVETGLIAYQVHRKFFSAGVGGTITNNLRALGVQVSCIGIVGDDGEGFELLRALQSVDADTSYMVKEESMCTSTYTKPMRKDENGVYREINRLDFRNFEEPKKSVQDQMLNNLKEALADADAVIITDQYFQRNQGAVTDYIRERLADIALEFPDKIFFADSRAFVNEYENMIVKCNDLEIFSKFGGVTEETGTFEEMIEKGKQAAEKTGHLFFVTRGNKGIAVFGDGEEVKLVPAFQVEGEIDIVGAGDATNAGIVTGLALGLDADEAALLGCCVSSITIQQIGTTGTASIPEVKERLMTYKAE